MTYPAIPALRKSTADLLTELGWCSATLHVPLRRSLVDHLAPGIQIIKCTRVRIPGEQKAGDHHRQPLPGDGHLRMAVTPAPAPASA